MNSNQYFAYSDESSYTDGRYRSISVVSLCASNFLKLNDEIKQITSTSNVDEFKWNKLKSAKYRFAAIKLIDWIFSNLHHLRIDTLVWDTTDSRHSIGRRDDIINLAIMYYRIYNHAVKQWKSKGEWILKPDQQSSIDWVKMRDILNYSSFSSRKSSAQIELFRIYESNKFKIERIEEVESSQEPMAQVADLFAGIASYSRNHFAQYKLWLESNDSQMNLFSSDSSHLSSGDTEKSTVLKHLDSCCKQRALGVSLKSQEGLSTRNPKCQLNFWLYTPQGSYDKAPVKS